MFADCEFHMSDGTTIPKLTQQAAQRNLRCKFQPVRRGLGVRIIGQMDKVSGKTGVSGSVINAKIEWVGETRGKRSKRER